MSPSNMGAVRYKYTFEQAPSIEEIADRFRGLTGLTMIVNSKGGWDLSASPLRGHVEIERAAKTLWVTPWSERLLGRGYFFAAFTRTLHELGAQRPPPRLPAYASRRWKDLPVWRRWLSR